MADSRSTGISVWGRIAAYLVGRNSLTGIASLMLLVISGYATWSGMADFIIGVSTSPAAAHGREIVGGLSVSNEIVVIAIVVALTFLMWLALRETFGYKRWLGERLIMFPPYLFLALWSIGFGYGFWWSLIAGEEATRTSPAALQEDSRDAGNAVAARLDAVKSQLDNVVASSDSQMSRYETSGGSCGVASGAGRGPLYNARRSVHDRVASLRDGIQRSWLEPMQADIQLLQQSAASLSGERSKRASASSKHAPARSARAPRTLPHAPTSLASLPLPGCPRCWMRSIRHRASRASPATTPPWHSVCARPPIRPQRRPNRNCVQPSSPKDPPASLTPSRTYGPTSVSMLVASAIM